ncbi:hypothetical protein AURDEDRAFT_173746 [Auricularia subglabra TFB-10046 SS5]|uniref:N-acetyltransferase domain-containing protein n=1 Tax=Auricularia subglabra (strain TFB-10046 / SS5) TaxID=717982 RepID=J0CZQ8_AURST|nr:hypothetical protein AURDEDRAFT_173746 [Auricularia subglabra TFB-10046 SS5]
MSAVRVLHRLSDAQRDQAIDLLVEIFQDELLTVNVLGGDRSLVRALMAAVLHITEHCGQVHVVSFDLDHSKRIDGIALWLPPGKEFVPTADSGWFDVVEKVAPDVREWWGPLFKAQEDQCKEILGETAQLDSWYLYCIGVRPALQRRGLGSRLMQYVTRKADAESSMIILNTPTIERTEFYEFNGLKNMGFVHVQSPRGPAWDQYLMARVPDLSH